MSMMRFFSHRLKKAVWLRSASAAATLLLCLTVPSFGSDPVPYNLCDIRVLYLFDNSESIDWPTIFYLNDNFGCRIDLLLVKPKDIFKHHLREVENKEIFLHEYYLPESNPARIDSLVAEVCREHRPDIILLDGDRQDRLFNTLSKYIINLVPTPDRLFNILRVYERIGATKDTSYLAGRVVLNGNELLNRYRKRMENEIPILFSWYRVQSLSVNRLTSYRLVKSNIPQEMPGADFTSGINPMRLTDILQRHLEEGPKKQTLLKYAQRFFSSFSTSRREIGRASSDSVINAYRQMQTLAENADFGQTLDSFVDFRPYLDNLLAKAEKAALEAVGLAWQGKIFLRGSPHGPKLKYLVSLSVNGPKEIELTSVQFHPYWDTSAIALDSIPKIIMPHQSYVKEYLIDIDRSHLEAEQPESLLFTTEIAYGKVPLVFSNTFPIGETPDLKIRFEPDYYFVQPFAKLEVDRVVSSMTLRVVISKPQSYSETAHLNLETPRGLFAGAYRQKIQLDKGASHKTVRIPFSISNLFELGIQHVFVTLAVNGKTVTTDTALVRIAACHIADTLKVGLLPDSSGALEDILRMTDACFQPLTNRALMTADLSAYNVIVIGSGSFRLYPSFGKIKDRFEDYLRHGGSIVIMGQPEDWPDGSLPVSLIPRTELLGRGGITNAIPGARILMRPYDISKSNFLSFFREKREVTSAVVSPAEEVYVCSSGGTLLSISRLGEGQIIYCGFPLLDMISKLEIDAIHLFANILNY